MPDPSSLRPLRRQVLFERIVAALQEYVVDNGLRVGDRLPSERELAAALQVGRSSVREAIATLRAGGMVEVRHGDGLFLRRMSLDAPRHGLDGTGDTSLDLPYIWETRQGLESQCARIAASRATPEDLEELAASLDLMADEIAQGLPGLDGDRRFHRGVARASHNPLLINLLEEVRDALDRTSAKSLTRPGQPARSLEDHRRILAAIRSHEPADAGDAMLAHLVGTTDPVLEHRLDAAGERRGDVDGARRT
ncbi:FadR/GntR family transcriptional regulator [Actinomycetospora corticicola]|uniref:GntR family transcriptional repressor for pyruvate dehydrogenase complex n=1 Tax=Actinomycetospora corticicola TaxID=663602 RepID=A0A7Y9DSN5_9PSEU|nr:FadR/GntR family transcriptional regulator [Actinomycetospora corticicola]NYD34457.1 GntR family transcriptional repressor for pyruvate dehydrogenase complex [Actinomycetospora corticicola]